MKPHSIDFDHLEITMSENNSFKVYEEITTEVTNWRCYNKNTISQEELAGLIDRFVKYHATVPGVVTEEMLSSEPLETFGFSEGELGVKGLLYVNGAVMQVRTPTHPTPHYMLFIDDRVANVWAYPDQFVILSEHIKSLRHKG